MIALWSRDALVALGPNEVARFRQLQFDGRVLGFTFLVAGLTSVAFGLWPAWRSAKTSATRVESRRTRKLRFPDRAPRAGPAHDRRDRADARSPELRRPGAQEFRPRPGGLVRLRTARPADRADGSAVYAYSDPAKIANFTQAVLEKVRALPGVKRRRSAPIRRSSWLAKQLLQGRRASRRGSTTGDRL